MRSKTLVFLLVLSLVANAYFVLFEEQPSFEGGQVQEMQARINILPNGKRKPSGANKSE